MKISFVLPMYQARVSGGFRVVYEYANRLSARGHEVTVVLPSPGIRYNSRPVVFQLGALRELARRIRHSGKIPWFRFEPNVRVLIKRVRSSADLPAADVVVATAWRTAPLVAASDRIESVGLYLIQHFEDWDGDRPDVEATWRLPLHKVAISRWLQAKAHVLDPGSNVTYIPNGMDLEAFRIRRPIEERSPFSVGMLFHESEWKGTSTGLEALAIAKSREPSLRAILYGYAARPANLPLWIEYREKLSGEDLYSYFNELAIFLHPSLAEGWPLPPAEAMASGVSLIAADNPGVLDYARAGETALVVPRGDSAAMADAILGLANDSDRRIELARAGAHAISEYTWDRAVDSFEELLRNVVHEDRPKAVA